MKGGPKNPNEGLVQQSTGAFTCLMRKNRTTASISTAVEGFQTLRAGMLGVLSGKSPELCTVEGVGVFVPSVLSLNGGCANYRTWKAAPVRGRDCSCILSIVESRRYERQDKSATPYLYHHWLTMDLLVSLIEKEQIWTACTALHKLLSNLTREMGQEVEQGTSTYRGGRGRRDACTDT